MVVCQRAGRSGQHRWRSAGVWAVLGVLLSVCDSGVAMCVLARGQSQLRIGCCNDMHVAQHVCEIRRQPDVSFLHIKSWGV